jgi:hypothetical protein
LLRRFSPHAGAESGSRNNSGDASHRRVTSLSQLRIKGEKTVVGHFPITRFTKTLHS